MKKIKRDRPDEGYSNFSGIIISKNIREVFTFESKNIEDIKYLKDFFNKINKLNISKKELKELSKSLRQILKSGTFTIKLSNTFLEVAEKNKYTNNKKT